jgi:hypothetical protein
MRLHVTRERRHGSTATRPPTDQRQPEARATPNWPDSQNDECTPAKRHVPADPYAQWLRRREADEQAERVQRQLANNPGAALENLKSWDPSLANPIVTIDG